jgi:hypothetical protein
MDLTTFKDIASAAQSVVAICAIIVGAVWGYMLFIVKGAIYPLVNGDIIATHVSMRDSRNLLYVKAELKNDGIVSIYIEKLLIKVRKIYPLPSTAIEQHFDPGNIAGEPKEVDTIDFCDLPLEVTIEPGNKVDYTYVFLIDDNIEAIEIKSIHHLQMSRGRLIRLLQRKESQRLVGWASHLMYSFKTQTNNQSPASATRPSPTPHGAP